MNLGKFNFHSEIPINSSSLKCALLTAVLCEVDMPKAIELLFVGGSMAFGVCTNCLSSFPPSTGQKWNFLQKQFLIL